MQQSITMQSSFAAKCGSTLLTSHSFLIHLLDLLVGVADLVDSVQVPQQGSVVRELQLAKLALKPLVTFKVCYHLTADV